MVRGVTFRVFVPFSRRTPIDLFPHGPGQPTAQHRDITGVPMMIPPKIKEEFAESERKSDHPDVNSEESYNETKDKRCAEHETANSEGANGIQKS